MKWDPNKIYNYYPDKSLFNDKSILTIIDTKNLYKLDYRNQYLKKNEFKWFAYPDDSLKKEVRQLSAKQQAIQILRDQAIHIPVVTPVFSGLSTLNILGTHLGWLYAAKQFNLNIPYEGVVIEIPLVKGLGNTTVTFWGFDVVGSTLHAKMTCNIEKDLMSHLSFRINGTRRTKKSSGEVTEIIIERFYAVDHQGVETTLHSII